MLRLNRMTDYAMIMLAALASRPGELVASAALAQQTQLNQTTIAKIAKELVRANIIIAERGVNGGYQLARTPQEITAADVIEALEGPIALTACVTGVADPCSTRHGCFMSGNWDEVNNAIRSALRNVTLSQLINPEALFPQQGLAHNFQQTQEQLVSDDMSKKV